MGWIKEVPVVCFCTMPDAHGKGWGSIWQCDLCGREFVWSGIGWSQRDKGSPEDRVYASCKARVLVLVAEGVRKRREFAARLSGPQKRHLTRVLEDLEAEGKVRRDRDGVHLAK